VAGWADDLREEIVGVAGRTIEDTSGNSFRSGG
jgi:hypothetical protein